MGSIALRFEWRSSSVPRGRHYADARFDGYPQKKVNENENPRIKCVEGGERPKWARTSQSVSSVFGPSRHIHIKLPCSPDFRAQRKPRACSE